MHRGEGLHDGQRIAHMQGAVRDTLVRAEMNPRQAIYRCDYEDTPGSDSRKPLGASLCSLCEKAPAPKGLCDDGGQMQDGINGESHRSEDTCRGNSPSNNDVYDIDDHESDDRTERPSPSNRGGLPRDPDHSQITLDLLPNELLFHILSFLDVCDLFSTSRVNRLLRQLSLTPLLHRYRLQRIRHLLPPLLYSPHRPSLADLIARSIFLTKTSVVSKRLARSLVSIRLSRRLAARPSVEALVDRAVLPKECVPGIKGALFVAPGLVAKRKEVEKERMKDMLRRWVDGKWRGEVRVREEDVKRTEEKRGVGRVWRLRRFWERVGRGEIAV